jgi:hypothetical protein
MTENQRRELEAYLNRPLSELEAELALYAPTQRGPADVWRKVAGPVRQWLCEDWNWCQVRQDARFENDLDLAMAVVLILSRHLAEIPLNADEVLIAAIVVKRGMDTFCQCS